MKTGIRASFDHRNRHRPALAFAALLGASTLAGCMSDGASSFSDALNVRQEQNVPAEPLPLDVASTGVVDATAAPLQEAAPLPGVAGQASETRRKLASDPVAARSLAGEQELDVSALAPETDGRTAAAEAQFAALAEPAVALDPATGEPVEPQPDPLEVAAEQRAEALYATMKHGQCSGGWGPKPKMINARRIDPEHKYYMEMRLRHTPPLPVGHVYIAYGRIGPDGEPMDEKLVMLAPVGGYAGATVAAAAPMPGVLEPYGDDCILRPIAAYRVSLTAQQYEKLLNRIVQARQDKPKYALWTYNCNHFMSDIAASVGILPPSNRYTPSLEYFYAMMDRNEGRKVARSATADTAQLAQN
jgi:hypothetical protein